MKKLLVLLVLGGLAVLVARQMGPDIKRYLRISRM